MNEKQGGRKGREREGDRMHMRGCAYKKINKHENMHMNERLIPSQ